MLKLPIPDKLPNQRIRRDKRLIDLFNMLQHRQQRIDLGVIVNVPQLLGKGLFVDT